jgi:hypothetical protein
MTATSVNQRRTSKMAEKHAAKKKAEPKKKAPVRDAQARSRLDVIENALEQELNIDLNEARVRLGLKEES